MSTFDENEVAAERAFEDARDRVEAVVVVCSICGATGPDDAPGADLGLCALCYEDERAWEWTEEQAREIAREERDDRAREGR